MNVTSILATTGTIQTSSIKKISGTTVAGSQRRIRCRVCLIISMPVLCANTSRLLLPGTRLLKSQIWLPILDIQNKIDNVLKKGTLSLCHGL